MADHAVKPLGPMKDEDSDWSSSSSPCTPPKRKRRSSAYISGDSTGSTSDAETESPPPLTPSGHVSRKTKHAGSTDLDKIIATPLIIDSPSCLKPINIDKVLQRIADKVQDSATFFAIYQRRSSGLDPTVFDCTPYSFLHPSHQPRPLTGPDPQRYQSFKFGYNQQADQFEAASDVTWSTSSEPTAQKGRRGLDASLSSPPMSRITTPSSPRGPNCHDNSPLDTSKLPVEVMDAIASQLSISDVRNMRLVNRDFERNVSGHFLDSVIIPFNSGIYGAFGQPPGLNDSVVAQKQVDVFRGFGPHIQRFGISFMVKEDDLRRPKTKKIYKDHQDWWGNFEWPTPEYPRFADRARLETTADETARMRLAFSHLRNVKHLALSVDSGLSWLPGEELSFRHRILQPGRQALTKFRRPIETWALARRRLWLAMEKAFTRAGSYSRLMCAHLVREENDEAVNLLTNSSSRHTSAPLGTWVLERCGSSVDGTIACPGPKEYNLKPADKDSSLFAARNDMIFPTGAWFAIPRMKTGDAVMSGMEPDQGDTSDDSQSESSSTGFWYTRPMKPTQGCEQDSGFGRLVPSNLTNSQQEWLMETSWAQDAFLTSYALAVCDSKSAFENVTSLTLSPFSSGHIHKLDRQDFWDALPRLSTVDIRVLPDWREIKPQPAGFITSSRVDLSDAVVKFRGLLARQIASRPSIKEVTLGYADGGEHQEGIKSRNAHLLPAPLIACASCLHHLHHECRIFVVELPYIQHLRLLNCWVAPFTLTTWVEQHASLALEKLTLESVSMTGSAREPAQHVAWPQTDDAPGPMLHQLVARLAARSRPMTAGGLQLLAQRLHEGSGLPIEVHINALEGLNALLQGYANGNPTARHVRGTVNQGGLPQPQMYNQGQQREDTWHSVLSSIKASCLTADKSAFQLSMLSCGYALLLRSTCDQAALDAAQAHVEVQTRLGQGRETMMWFKQRRDALDDNLLKTNDRPAAQIIQALPAGEMEELEHDWGMQEGWPSAELAGADYDDDDGWGKWGQRSKDAALFDGKLLGGSGRFSGRIDGF